MSSNLRNASAMFFSSARRARLSHESAMLYSVREVLYQGKKRIRFKISLRERRCGRQGPGRKG